MSMADGTPTAGAGALVTTLRRPSVQGLRRSSVLIAERWSLHYDQAELLRVLTVIAIQVIELDLVRPQGLHLALVGVALAPPGAEAAPPHAAGPGSTKIWVGGSTRVGLEWVRRWLQERDRPASWREVLEVVIDLSLQALEAGLVARPIGPYIRVHPPEPGVG